MPGGRDNVTVVLFRVEDVGGAEDTRATEELRALASPPPPGVEEAPTAPERLVAAERASATSTSTPPRRVPRIHRRAPRMPRGGAARRARSRMWRRIALTGVVLAVLGALAAGGLLAAQAVYFIGADPNGQVTVYNGLPYTLPGGVRLYTPYFVSGVTAAELSPLERGRLFNNQLRSQQAATRLVSQLELGRIAGQ